MDAIEVAMNGAVETACSKSVRNAVAFKTTFFAKFLFPFKTNVRSFVTKKMCISPIILLLLPNNHINLSYLFPITNSLPVDFKQLYYKGRQSITCSAGLFLLMMFILFH